MKLKIEIKMENAAFESSQGCECARILRTFCELVEDSPTLTPGTWSTLNDINGNSVGKAWVTK